MMNAIRHSLRLASRLFAVALIWIMGSVAQGQTAPATGPVTDPDPTVAINKLRTELVDAFNKADVERLLSHLDGDVVVTWQNGEVSRGPGGVREYYQKMMSGPDRRVHALTADPVVEERHIYGDWAVSQGNLRDQYTLNDGTSFRFDSRFTATVARRGEQWKVISFHASVNAFDNPILRIAARKVGTWAAVIGAVLGVVVGVVVGVLVARRKRAVT